MSKKILYGAAFLICGLMALGLAINYIGKWIGVVSPLNSTVILISFWFAVLMVFLINKERTINWFKSFKLSIPIPIYLLIILPIMAVGGAELVNYAHSNILLMVMLPLVAVMPIICMFTKLIPEKYWAFTIFMIALAVVLHRVLISPYLWGSDNIVEYSVFRAVNLAGIWNPNLVNSLVPAYNCTLSVSILPMMISKITFINGLWVFKVVFPIILALVPVGMYEIIKKHFNNKIAFMACFLFISLYTFFTAFLQLDKQLIAVFLMVVFILVMFDKDIKNRVLILGMLGIGIIVAHYSTAVLFLVLIAGIAVLLFRKKVIPIYLPIALAAFYFLWYWFIGNGIVLRIMFIFGQNVTAVPTAPSAVGNPAPMVLPQNEAVRIMTQGSVNMPHSMLYLYLLVIGAIVLGVAVTLWRQRKGLMDWGFLLLALIMCAILGSEIVLPRVSSVITLERMFPLALIIIAPFMFVGLQFILKKKYVFLSVLFLAVFFLANTGFIYQLINQPLANSMALSAPAEFPVFTTAEIQGANWLIANVPSDKIFYDSQTVQLFIYKEVMADALYREGTLLTREIDNLTVANNIPKGSFIYLRKYNIVNNDLSLGYVTYEIMDTKFVPIKGTDSFSKVIETSKVMFDNGGCRILETTEDYETSVN